MPTDPFVSPQLDDAPRHRQNLPSGIGYPAARVGQGHRTAEVGPDRPEGPLFGSPGPNVGYGYTLVLRAADRFVLAPHESIDDATAVVAEIAMRRAGLYGRAPVIGDIELAMGLLGYDGSASDAFAHARAERTHHASHEYMARRAIVNSVPEELLRVRPQEAAGRAAEWRAALAGAAH